MQQKQLIFTLLISSLVIMTIVGCQSFPEVDGKEIRPMVDSYLAGQEEVKFTIGKETIPYMEKEFKVSAQTAIDQLPEILLTMGYETPKNQEIYGFNKKPNSYGSGLSYAKGKKVLVPFKVDPALVGGYLVNFKTGVMGGFSGASQIYVIINPKEDMADSVTIAVRIQGIKESELSNADVMKHIEEKLK